MYSGFFPYFCKSYSASPSGMCMMSTYTYMNKQEIVKSYILTFCIEQLRQSRGITGAEASGNIFSSGIAAYLADNFEVLHNQIRQWLYGELFMMVAPYKRYMEEEWPDLDERN